MEIVTLQCGSLSNHVGAHFWNYDDEVKARKANPKEIDSFERNEDDLSHQFYFEADRGQHYYPRAVVVEARGGAGSLDPHRHSAHNSSHGAAQDPQSVFEAYNKMMSDYGSNIEVIEQEPIPHHTFQHILEEEERYWEEGEEEEEGYGDAQRGYTDAHGNETLLPTDNRGGAMFDTRSDGMYDTRTKQGASAYGAGSSPQKGLTPGSNASTSCPLDSGVLTRGEQLAKDLESIDWVTNAPRYWSDFLKVRYSPSNTYYELQGVRSGQDFHYLSARGNANYNTTGTLRREVEDKIAEDLLRKQIEMCDSMDAIHAFVDSGSGFGYVGAELLRYVREEQPKCAILVGESYDRYGAKSSTDDGMGGSGADRSGGNSNSSGVNDNLSPLEKKLLKLTSQDVGRGLFYREIMESANVVLPFEPSTWSRDALNSSAAIGAINGSSAFEVGSLLAPALHTLSWIYHKHVGLSRPRFSAGDFLRSFDYRIAGLGCDFDMNAEFQVGGATSMVNPFYADLTRGATHAEMTNWFLSGETIGGTGMGLGGNPATKPQATPEENNDRMLLYNCAPRSQDVLTAFIADSISERKLVSVVSRGRDMRRYETLLSALPHKAWHPFLYVDSDMVNVPLPFPQRRFMGIVNQHQSPSYSNHAFGVPSSSSRRSSSSNVTQMSVETVLRRGIRKGESIQDNMSMVKSMKDLTTKGRGNIFSTYDLLEDDLRDTLEDVQEYS